MVDNFRIWIKSITNQFETYLEIPEQVSYAYDLFEKSDLSLSDRFEKYLGLMNTCNINFLTCSNECTGVTCECAKIEFENFFNHFEDNREIMKLNVTNSIRLVEVVCLLKASQSACERIMSVLKQVVKGRFESVYKDKSEVEMDVVNMETIVTMNSDFRTFDAERAATLYLKKHLPAVIKSNPNKRNKTVVTNEIHAKNKKRRLTKIKPFNIINDNDVSTHQPKDYLLKAAKALRKKNGNKKQRIAESDSDPDLPSDTEPYHDTCEVQNETCNKESPSHEPFSPVPCVAEQITFKPPS